MAQTNLVGKTILGYKVTEKINAGAFGTVYKAVKENASGQYVRALKHITIPTQKQYNSVLNSMGGDIDKANDYFASMLDSIVSEIHILDDLSERNSSNIVRYYENDIVVTEKPRRYDIYILMEYLTPLDEYIEEHPFTVKDVVALGTGVLQGLQLCHSSHIIHRDIKPQNIMILENGLVKITDFGIAMAMNATQLTQTNSVMGSVHYLPPEQASGQGSTLQSDIYSMGIVMYELLTGELPFKGDNAVEIALKHLKEPIPDIREKIPNVPNSIYNIIKRATAKNPKNRYNDAREMHEDLLTCLDDTRANEPIITFKYPENDTDDAKLAKMVKESKKETEEVSHKKEEVIAKKITGDDLKKQNKLLIILAFIFTGLVVGITALIVFIPMLTGSKQIEVPDVADMTVSDAIDTLQDAGFTVSDEQKEVSSSDIEEGRVVKTSPAVGSKRKDGTTVTLYVSIGDTQIEIEDYTGESYLEVKGKLEALGLFVLIERQDVEETDDVDYEDGLIIDQSIEAGEKVSAGTNITLYIPNVVTNYPNFTDGTYTVEAIEDFADTYELTLDIEYVKTNEYTPGTIYYQSRPEGQRVVAGQTFKIRVAEALEEGETGETEECETPGLC